MAENTVEVDGVEFNAENLLEAAQNVAEQPDGCGMSLVDDVCVVDDGHDDRDVKIHSDGNVSAPRFDVNRAVDMAETVLEDTLESYVKQLLDGIDGETEIGDEIKGRMSNTFGHGYDLLLWKHYSLTAEIMRELIDNDGIEVGYVRPVDNGVLVGLNDAREL